MSKDDRELEKGKSSIDQFLDALWVERGLSDNTLQAYRSDLYGFAEWQHQQGNTLLDSKAGELLVFLGSSSKRSVRTTARRLSSLRRFFQFLINEGLIKEDPTSTIESPRLGRPLPKTLTESEVEALLHAPDIKTDIGIRDRTMLEVLYATGLRGIRASKFTTRSNQSSSRCDSSNR